MDLRSLGIDLPAGRVVLTLRHATGDTAHELAGEAAGRVIEALAPLLERLGEGGARPQRLSVNPIAGTLRLDRDEGQILLDGEAYLRLAPLLREPARIASREARPRAPDLPSPRDDAELWEHKYLAGGEGWELMRPPPPLLRWLAAHPVAPGALALVPGAGRGHEARLLAARGARVTAIDIAKTAVAECRRLAEAEGLGERVEALPLDAFALPPEHRGRYDLVLEHCCFCAIDPARRDEYVAALGSALRPGGRLVGLFWCHPYPGGPPWGSTRAEVEARFSARFHLRAGEVPTDSILVRAEHELLLDMEKKDAI